MIETPSLTSRLDRTGVPLLLARLLVGGMLISMGWSKLAGDPVHFLKLIKLYNILPLQPPYFLNATAVTLPWIEILCGAALVLGVWVRGAALTVLGMLIAFTLAIFFRTKGIYAEGGQAFCAIRFDCGCGGGEVNACGKLLSNTGLIVATAVALFSRSRRFCLGALGRSPREAGEAALSPQA